MTFRRPALIGSNTDESPLDLFLHVLNIHFFYMRRLSAMKTPVLPFLPLPLTAAPPKKGTRGSCGCEMAFDSNKGPSASATNRV